LSATTIVRALTAASVILALLCVLLALAWTREHREAECWRVEVEDNQAPAEGDCHRPLKIGSFQILP